MIGIAIWIIAFLGSYSMAGWIGVAVVFTFYVTATIIEYLNKKEHKKKQKEKLLFLLGIKDMVDKAEKEHLEELAAKGITQIREEYDLPEFPTERDK